MISGILREEKVDLLNNKNNKSGFFSHQKSQTLRIYSFGYSQNTFCPLLGSISSSLSTSIPCSDEENVSLSLSQYLKMAIRDLHLLVSALFLSTLFTATPSRANVEGDALYALRRNVKDPNNVLESWDPTLVDPCTWFHVTCDGDNRVTRLDLGNAKLSGTLTPALGKLERLQYLELYMNHLEGSIPKEVGGLKNLVSFDLYHNNLTGSIPSSLSKLSNLKFLRLNGNRLTGRIPRELTKLGNLKIIDVSENDLCGTIPTTGSFSKFSEESYRNNPRLEGPELMGFVRYESGGSC